MLFERLQLNDLRREHAWGPEQSVAPDVYPDEAWVPALGPVGLTCPNIGKGRNGGSGAAVPTSVGVSWTSQGWKLSGAAGQRITLAPARPVTNTTALLVFRFDSISQTQTLLNDTANKIEFRWETTPILRLNRYVGWTNSDTFTWLPVAGQWYSFVYRIEAGEDCACYVDGALAHSEDISENCSANIGSPILGTYNTGTNRVIGTYAAVAWWNRAISKEDCVRVGRDPLAWMRRR